MIRRHLVRGYNEKIFFAESSGNVDKIFQVEFHPSKPNEITKHEIYQLAGGKMAAFEPDGECIQNDIEEDQCIQSFFIMDDSQKIYLLQNEEGVRFRQKKLIDFSRHNKAKEVNILLMNDWAHVHVTERTLTIDDKTYNLATQLSMKVSIPKNYFGKESSKQLEFDDDDSEKDSSDEGSSDEDNVQDEWQISSVQGMSMTTNMLVVGQRAQKEFCFVLKPAPGSRKISIVGFQQLHEIEQMLFVTNHHILLNFRGGKSVTLLANGSIIHQESRVQDQLEKSERVIGESQLYQGKKTIVLEDEYGENNEKVRHIALRFTKRGQASLVGIFEDFKLQIDAIFHRRKQLIAKEFEKEKEMLNEKRRQSQSGQQLQSQNSFKSDANNSANASVADISREQQLQLVVHEKLVQNATSEATNSIFNKLNMFMPKKMQIEVPKKQEKEENKIRYAKEYFVTERGEVIKMGAIVSPNPHIRGKLLMARQELELRNEKKALSGTIETNYISIFKIEDTKDLKTSLGVNPNETSAFTVIIFHALDEKTQTEFVSKTQYCVVGNYLCHRRRNKQEIWVSKLKENVDELIQDQKKVKEEETSKIEDLYKEYESICISIDKMTRKVMIPHIQLTEVPKAYFTTIKAKQANESSSFYDNLLQITIGTHGMIYDLDSLIPHPKEVDSIEYIDQLMKPDTYVNTGFIMSISHNCTENNIEFRKRIQIFTNEYQSLLFEKVQSRFQDGSAKFSISGMLYRTYSEIDLQELRQVQHCFDHRMAKINMIDPEAILCQFEGHSIFSIFFDRILVYEQILRQLSEMEYEDDEDINGEDRESSVVRRLYRILNMPTGDLANFKDKESRTGKKKEPWYRRLKQHCLKKCGKDENEQKQFEARSILKKSMYFKNSRFRDILMELALLCQENAINDFLDNVEDIKVLFTSMSPSTVRLFENGFKTTRHTEGIKNADWRQGDTLEVIGAQSSVIMEKDANKLITKRQKKFFSDQGNIQNRQIEAKMLQIDWIFADCGSKNKVGFADLVVALANAPHESLFSTQLIKTLIDHFWTRYYRAVIFKCFFPFFGYMIATLIYISKYTVVGVNPDERWQLTSELANRIIVVVLTTYFLYFEFKSILRDGLGYFREVFNYLDILSFTANIYCLEAAMEGEHEEGSDFIRGFAALAVLLMWFKAFYWLRLFGPTSFFIRLIQDTLYDLRYFLILFVLILLTFGNALLILSMGRWDECEEGVDEDCEDGRVENRLYKNYFSEDYMNVFLNQYELSLGEFDTDERFKLASEGGDTLAWVTFIGATLITQVMFLNMLIAIMGDTFERVTESREQSALVEKIRILADYVYVVPYETERDGTMNKFLFQLQPLTLGSDEMGSWEGTATMLRNVVEHNVSSATKQINAKMAMLQSSVQDGYDKISLLEDRMNELHGSSQRQQGMILDVLTELRKIREAQEISMTGPDDQSHPKFTRQRTQNDYQRQFTRQKTSQRLQKSPTPVTTPPERNLNVIEETKHDNTMIAITENQENKDALQESEMDDYSNDVRQLNNAGNKIQSNSAVNLHEGQNSKQDFRSGPVPAPSLVESNRPKTRENVSQNAEQNSIARNNIFHQHSSGTMSQFTAGQDMEAKSVGPDGKNQKRNQEK